MLSGVLQGLSNLIIIPLHFCYLNGQNKPSFIWYTVVINNEMFFWCNGLAFEECNYYISHQKKKLLEVIIIQTGTNCVSPFASPLTGCIKLWVFVCWLQYAKPITFNFPTPLGSQSTVNKASAYGAMGHQFTTRLRQQFINL